MIRKIEKGNLYVPIRGERFDGHAFMNKAVENGAVATLWMKDAANHLRIFRLFCRRHAISITNVSKNYRDQLDVKVIGVTGSNGKTSTKIL